MNLAVPEPDGSVTDPAARISEYLDYFRAEARRKSSDLDPAQLARTVVPSGWTVTSLIEHLAHMERRWIVWGFLGEHVDQPNADRNADGHWITRRSVEEILADLDAVGQRTREVVAAHGTSEIAAATGMFGPDDVRPTLLAILFHVMQEHARHAGHLDIARELIDGLTTKN